MNQQATYEQVDLIHGFNYLILKSPGALASNTYDLVMISTRDHNRSGHDGN